MEENEITSPFVEDATTPDTGSTQPTAPAPKRKNWFRRHTKLFHVFHFGAVGNLNVFT